MSEYEKTKKKKRKPMQVAVLEEKKESPTFIELVRVLEKLEKEGKFVDIQICPKCKSPKVRRVGTLSGDLWGHMGILPPKFECEECGWRARLVLKATNKPLSIKDVEIVAEAIHSDKA
jgi:ssDNA-binding Zn-finger/Zn-ribbon topoisomerase 1